MESYSSSIQKIGVFVNPQLEITNSGISYFNTFLINLGNSIVIETINRSKQQNNVSITIEALQEAVAAIFPYDMSEYIVDQSQGRIQHTSMKNLPAYKPYSDGEIDQDDEEDEDVEGFEIIPRDSTTTAQSISLFFPTELVYNVTHDMIKRKKVTISDLVDFYEPIEIQSKDSFIYTFLSYCMEIVTNRILKKLADVKTEITEDTIRRTIEIDPSLKEIRHKVVQISNNTNALLRGESVLTSSSLVASDIMTSSSIFSSNNSTILKDSIIDEYNNPSQTTNNDNNSSNDDNNNNNLNDDTISTTTIESNDNSILDNATNDTPTTTTTIENNVNNNNENTSDIITSPFITLTDNNNNNNDEATNITTTTNTNDILPTTELINNTTTTTTTITTTKPVSPTISIEKELTSFLKNNHINNLLKSASATVASYPSSSSSSSSIPSLEQKELLNKLVSHPKCKDIQSIFNVTQPYDLLDIIRDGHIYFEAKNCTFLVFLILLGLAIQSLKCSEVY